MLTSTSPVPLTVTASVSAILVFAGILSAGLNVAVFPLGNVTTVSLSTLVSSVYTFPGISFCKASVGFLVLSKIAKFAVYFVSSILSFVTVSTVA